MAEYKQERLKEEAESGCQRAEQPPVDINEVMKDIDALKAKWRGRTVAEKLFGGIEGTLRESFTPLQLRAYLKHCQVRIEGHRTRRLTKIIMEDAWQMTSRTVRAPLKVSKEIPLDADAIYFLLGSDGKVVQEWSNKYPVKIEIRKEQRLAVVSGKEGVVSNVAKLLKQYLQNIRYFDSRLALPEAWTVDKEIMKATGTYITKPGPDQLKISSLEDDSAIVRKAENYIRDSVRLYEVQPSVSVPVPAGMLEHEMTVHLTRPSLVRRRFKWMRSVVTTTGVQLPFYYLNSIGPKPLKAAQVNARPTRRPFDLESAVQGQRNVVDLLRSHTAGQTCQVTFGFALHAIEHGVHHFSTDIPGLFNGFRALTPAGLAAFEYKLVLTSPKNTDAIEIVVNVKEAIEDTTYIAARVSRKHLVIRASAHSTDLRISAVSNHDIPASPELDTLIKQCDLRTRQTPVIFHYLGTDWDVALEVVSTLKFAVGDHDPRDLHLAWRRIRKPLDHERTQELCVMAGPEVDANDIAAVLRSTVHRLDAQ